MKEKRVAVLASGGLDSCILLRKMSEEYDRVFPVYVRCGLVWERAELYWLKKFLKKARMKNVQGLVILNNPVSELYKYHWSLTGKGTPPFHSPDQEVYLPGRNLLLLSKTAVFCVLNQIPRIALGILKGNPFLDSTRAFFSDFEKSVKKGTGSEVKILTPFAKLTKSHLMRRIGDLPVRFSFSCLNPKGIKSCGNCNKCAEMEKVFNSGNVIPSR